MFRHPPRLWLMVLGALCAGGIAVAVTWRSNSADDAVARGQASQVASEPSAGTPAEDSTAAPPATDHRIGKQIADFTLMDYYGQQRSLKEFEDAKLLVIAFLGTECPLAILYTPRLSELAVEYQDQGVAFVGINSNCQDSMTELRVYCEMHSIEFPVLKDLNNVVADQFEAVRTPEVFVLDADRRIRYWGCIDEKFGFDNGIGYDKLHEPRHDLKIALDDLLAGKPVSVPVTVSMGCHIGRVYTAAADSPVTWSRQIARIFQRRCQQCHREGDIAPFPLITYEDVHGWEAMIHEVAVVERRMPPWHADPRYGEFLNDPSLTEEEISLIDQWVAHGAPEGDPGELPERLDFSSIWAIEEPDLIVYMDEEPFAVPATGVLDNIYYLVDPGIKKGVWVAAAEARPDCKPVVHHMDVTVVPAEGDWLDLVRTGQVIKLTGYVPGLRVKKKDGAGGIFGARYLPAGSRFVFEMHYKTNGAAHQDRSSVALKFVEPPRGSGDTAAAETAPETALEVVPRNEHVDRELVTVLVGDGKFSVPPHAANYRCESSYTFVDPGKLRNLHCHMHTRGKSMRFVAHYPDGRQEILLDVPRYDYYWQHSYTLKEPKFMPAGTRIQCIAHYDNSAENLRNPNPNDTVVYGKGYYSHYEMMGGTISYLRELTGEERVVFGSYTPDDRRFDIHVDGSEKIQQRIDAYLPAGDVPKEKLPVYYMQRGNYRELLGDIDGAIADYSGAIVRDEDFVEAYFRRAKAWQAKGDLRRSLNDFNKVTSLDTQHAEAYILRGRMWKDLTSQLADFDRAIAADPRCTEAYMARGVALEQAGDADGAIMAYSAAIKIHPAWEEAYFNRGRLLLNAGRDTESEADFAFLMERVPRWEARICFKRAVVRINQSRFSDALSDVWRNFELRPDDPTIVSLLIFCYQESGQWEAAEAEVSAALENAPEHADLHWGLGRARLRLGRFDLALPELREALRLDPEHPYAVVGLAWILATHPDQQQRDGTEALAMAQRAVSAAAATGGNRWAFDSLAAAYAEVGQMDDACAAAQQAIELAVAKGHVDHAAEIRDRLESCYQANRPYRATLVD